MYLRIYDPRILAIDLRHRRFGYAVYEGHRRIIDWGICTYPAVGKLEAALAGKRLAGLLRLFSPAAVVVKKERWEMASAFAYMSILVDEIARTASSHATTIYLVAEVEVKATFTNLGCGSKDERAAVLTRLFPELIWNLPPKRRAWQSQPSSMTIFDAIALGLAYWLRWSGQPLPPPPE